MYDLLDGCIINADEARISQAVTNLVSNAIKYTPNGGNIVAKTSTERSKIVFSIENESKHFSQEELSKVWESFYRTDSARSDGGTGLGLAITKSIIDLHGGECFVQNTNTGVRFGFRI